MANKNIYFNNKNYQIDESAFSSVYAVLKEYLLNTMNGSGATINFDGVAYNVDSTKLTTETNEFISHLGTVAGSGSKVTVNGIQYNIDYLKLSDAVTAIENVLGNIKPDNKSNIAYGCRYRLASNKNNGYAVMYENGTLETYNADDTLASSATVQYVVSNDGRTYVNVDGNEFGYVTADGKTLYMLMGEENGEPIYWNWDLEESGSGDNSYPNIAWGQKYISVDSDSYVFYEDGSVEAYTGDSLVVSKEAGWFKYVVNEDGTTSILVSSEDGESYTDYGYYVTADGKTFYLVDTPFTLETNDSVMNEYGFYFGKAYTGDVTGYGKVSMVFYRNNTADVYIDGSYNSTITAEYSENIIDMLDMNVTGTVNSDGTQISVPDMGATIILEECSIVFGGKYSYTTSDGNKKSIKLYYDGSGKVYIRNQIATVAAGYFKYVINEDGTTSILAPSTEDGENNVDYGYVAADGKTLYLDGDIYILESNSYYGDVILEEQTIEGFAYDEDAGTYSTYMLNDLDLFEVGVTYIVIWDGTEYRYEAMEGDGLIGIGGENSNPFGMVVIPKESMNLSKNVFAISTVSTASSHTVAIYKVVENNNFKDMEMILEESEHNFEFSSSLNTYVSFDMNLFSLEEGETYKVVWDGEEFLTKAYVHTYNGYEAIFIGNESYIKGESNELNEPFCIYKVFANNICFLASMDNAPTHTVAIYKVIDESSDFPIEWNSLEVMGNPTVNLGAPYVKISDVTPSSEVLEKLTVTCDEKTFIFAQHLNVGLGSAVSCTQYEYYYEDESGTGHTELYKIYVVYEAGNYSGIEVPETGLYVIDSGSWVEENADYVIDYATT